jgi:hypothetical protein
MNFLTQLVKMKFFGAAAGGTWTGGGSGYNQADALPAIQFRVGAVSPAFQLKFAAVAAINGLE